MGDVWNPLGGGPTSSSTSADEGRGGESAVLGHVQPAHDHLYEEDEHGEVDESGVGLCFSTTVAGALDD